MTNTEPILAAASGPHYSLVHADCLSWIDEIKEEGISLLLSDPPYGCRNDCDYTRFTGGKAKSKKYRQIEGDDKPFDPSPWLGFPNVVLFGFQFFADKLPVGTVLVWNKKREEKLGKFLSDCELAWMKGGKGCYLFNHYWSGFDRQSERGKSLHPSQKPVALLKWIIRKQKLPKGSWICDPYMGSGSTGVAAIELGYNFLGYEKDKEYFEIAARRVQEAKYGSDSNLEAGESGTQDFSDSGSDQETRSVA